MSKRVGVVAAALLVGVASGAALAVDAPIPGRLATVRTAKLAKLVAKNTPPALFPLPAAGSADDPTLVGGAIEFFDTSFGGAGAISLNLAAAGWTALGSPPGSRGYKYKGAAVGGACSTVLIKDRTIKAVCKGASVALLPPFAGTAAVQITTGALRYCAEFGGTTKKNVAGNFKRKNAPPPGVCVSSPLAPTATSTVAPSSTPTHTPTGGITNTPTRTPTNTPTNTPATPGSCPLLPGTYTMIGQPGGTLATATVAPFPFPAGGTIVQEVGPGDANCVHQTVVPFPGGFGAPVFCIPGVMFSVKVVQTGCGVGRIDSNGGSDFTITERGDTDDQSATCNLPHPNCVNGPPPAPVAGKVDSKVRVEVTVGNGAADTCAAGATGNAATSIPVFTTTWIEFSSGFSCPSNDGTFDPGDTLITQFPQILDFTTDRATSSWADLDGSGCFIVGSGPQGGFTGVGTCINFSTNLVTNVATGTVGSAGGPYYDLGFINSIPNSFTGPTALTGATCASPPAINFNGQVTRCLSAP